MPTITAAVAREQGKPLTLEQLELDDIRLDEARVRMVATGICHTDADGHPRDGPDRHVYVKRGHGAPPDSFGS